jgi:uncharacterized protein YlzI (FlbEa/FlbD family)
VQRDAAIGAPTRATGHQRRSIKEESQAVITVTRLDGTELVVNAELIQLIEATPDTHLTLTDGRRLIVQEDSSEIVARVIAYRRAAYGPMRAMQVAR